MDNQLVPASDILPEPALLDLSGPWTMFWDMHSGGSQKLSWHYIILQAPEDEARVIFYNRFGRDPEHVTCQCCGEDYSVSETDTLIDAVGYHLNWHCTNDGYIEEPAHGQFDAYRKDHFMSMADWLGDPRHHFPGEWDGGVLIVLRDEIRPEERLGTLPSDAEDW